MNVWPHNGHAHHPYYPQSPYSNPQYYHHGHLPPPGYGLSQHHPPPPQAFSKKYPNLHPALAADCTTLRYNVRKKPQEDILGTTFMSLRHQPAMVYAASHIRIISKAFPWTIDVIAQGPVTCENLFVALWEALQQPLADSEWGLAIENNKLKGMIEKCAKNRAEKDGDKALKRIDWLGDNTHFKGLEKIEEFEKARLLPGKPGVAETWVLKLSN